VPKSMILRSVCCLILFAASSLSQNTKVATDKQALGAIKNISDPQQKLDALRQFLVQYPKSSRTGAAQSLILETLVKAFPSRTSEIHQQVNIALNQAQGDFRMYDYDEVAGILADDHAELPLARKISEKSLKMLREKTFTTTIKKRYLEAKMKPPEQAELEKDYRQAQSLLQSTLARINVKEGNVAAGQTLLKAAYSANPDNSAAAAALGMLDDKAGKSDEALTYLTRARLTGKLEADQQKRLEELYAQQHAGSMSGFENYLDDRYASIFPLPFEAGRYEAAGKGNGRTVLEELFTGAGCAPCAGADIAMDAELARYDRKEVAVLEFDQHIPEPDPLSNPDSVERFNYYDGTGTPTLAIDGTNQIVGSNRVGAKDRFNEINKRVEQALATPPEAQIHLIAWRKGNDIEVKASATDVKSASKDLKLQIALVENRVRYSGENSIRFHPMVVRSLARDDDGFAVDAGAGCVVQYTFDTQKISEMLKTYLDKYEKVNDRFGPITFIQKMYSIHPAAVSVVAFVQDAKTRHVLQAAYAQVMDKP
jgi:hypothetical protein